MKGEGAAMARKIGKSLSVLTFMILAGAWMMDVCLAAAQEPKKVEKRPIVYNVAPVRIIQDPYATFNGIAVDSVHDEVVMSDSNRKALLTYDRLTKVEGIAEPLRTVIGPKTHLGHPCGVAIDPESEELFVVDSDWKHNLCVFPRQAKGNEGPIRELNIDITTWGIFVDRKNDELVMTSEFHNKVSVYRRTAKGDDEPLRIIQGPNTGLAAPHGVFVDAEHDEIFVANHGDWHKVETGQGWKLFFGKRGGKEPTETIDTPSSGKFLPPSITVYPRKANGDVAPIRTIQGPKTQLNWPSGIYVDPISDQIVVANTGDNSILFFERTANGDVAPVRIIRGEATGLDNPTAVVIDTKNNELWAVNWDNHTATVYPRTAKGNVAPLRTIRSAPKDAPVSAGFAGPAGIAYDPKRKQILVGN